MNAIVRKKGNLFNQVTKGHIVHGCNAQGVMGSGIAAQIRRLYPAAYEEYHAAHRARGLRMGEVISVKVEPLLFVHNAVTQEFFGSDGKKYVSEDAIVRAFEDVCVFATADIIPCRDIHFPLIGCGLGGGDEDVILPLISAVLEKHSLRGTLWVL